MHRIDARLSLSKQIYLSRRIRIISVWIDLYYYSLNRKINFQGEWGRKCRRKFFKRRRRGIDCSVETVERTKFCFQNIRYQNTFATTHINDRNGIDNHIFFRNVMPYQKLITARDTLCLSLTDREERKNIIYYCILLLSAILFLSGNVKYYLLYKKKKKIVEW